MDTRFAGQVSEDSAEKFTHRTETIISGILRIGVLVSLFLVMAGIIVSFFYNPDYASSSVQLQDLTRPGAIFPHTPGSVMAGLRNLDGQAIIALGLLLLIMTPVIRVGVSVFIFWHQRDRIFILITATVFFLLLLSFVVGWTERSGWSEGHNFLNNYTHGLEQK